MESANQAKCPRCDSTNLLLRYEVAYRYSYALDDDSPGRRNDHEFLPYLYDNREQKQAVQYIECRNCGEKYPCYFDKWSAGIDGARIQAAMDAALKNRPSGPEEFPTSLEV